MAKLSLTRILSELKLVDKKIMQLLEKPYIAVYTKRNPVINLKSKEDFEKEAKENLQAMKDLLKHKAALRKALAKANAETAVSFKGETYTINELLTMKNDLIPIKQDILKALQTSLTKTTSAYEQKNIALEQQVEQMLMQTLGKDRKAAGDEYATVAKPFIEENKIILSDAAGISTYVETLNKEITEFNSDVDILLSEVNSKTEVEV